MHYTMLSKDFIENKHAMDKGVTDTVKNHKRQHDDDDDDPPVRPNQGNKTKKRRTKELESAKKPSTTKESPRLKAPSKGPKSGKSATAKERVKEPIAKVIMDDAVNTTGEDVEHLKTSDRKKTYTTSITKIKATRTLKIVRDELRHRVLNFHLGYNDDMSRRK
uniref:Uncharacterized protein n=1 Tax=Tanacetum cinerariifolium TaxID=118510 RepID=A0A699IQP7_TANCI|nr:hypothetical protein [Tanacetum cinerariifolium]